MGRSLQIRPDRIDEIKSRVKLRGFPSQSALGMELGLSRATVNNYLNGKPVDYLNFVEISEKLGLSWLEISLQDEPIKQDGILIKKKVFSLNRELKVNFNDLFKALTKFVGNFNTGNYIQLPGDVIDALFSIDLEPNSSIIAWELIFRSLGAAICELVKDNISLFPYEYKNFCTIEEEIEFSLEDKEIIINRSFFSRPKDLLILLDIQKPLEEWLGKYEINEAQVKSISNRLSSYFVFALNEEYNRTPNYGLLNQHLTTPFADATRNELSWLHYSAWLQKQIDEPMFAEAFSLKQIYVEPLAYYEQEINNDTYRDYESGKKQEKQYEKIVVDLASYLDDWLTKSNKEDAIRIISGDPGAGKSSFAKMFAARQAEKQQIPVLFIPLHHFDPTGDLVETVGRFIRDDEYLYFNPLDGELKESRLLIIFDGLDELSMQGKIGAEVARSFINEIQKTVSRINYRQTHLQVVISGRPIAISSNKDEFRKSEQVLHILPYFVSEDQRNQYKDHKDLLKEDRRNIWWQKYGEVTGKNYKKMPPELKLDNLFEITIQPLLNYLIALSYTRSIDSNIEIEDKIIFSEDTNINAIYEDLLKSVYNRGWDTAQHPTLKGIKYNEFVRILEEIALATWHGNGRTTTVKVIQSHCESSGLKRLLEIFTKGAEAGVTNLLTAFYFRQNGYSNQGDRTFEFTHKSFGEYLTARRIVRELAKINRQLKLREEDPDEGWDEKQALTKWIIIFGMTAIDEYLFDFICHEIRLYKKEEAREWQLTLCHLIGYMLRQGMPLERINPRPSYKEECRQSINAEEALLVVLNACAKFTKEISNIEWRSKQHSFRKWIFRLQSSFENEQKIIVNKYLSWLNLEEADLSGLNFERANLSHTYLYKAKLFRINLKNANLYYVNLYKAAMRNANLFRANFRKANLQDVDFRSADLAEANFVKANLDRANLYNARLRLADFDRAYLYKTNLQKTDLRDANFTDADFRNADFRDAIIDNELRAKLAFFDCTPTATGQV